jgi:hypothetical protein
MRSRTKPQQLEREIEVLLNPQLGRKTAGLFDRVASYQQAAEAIMATGQQLLSCDRTVFVMTQDTLLA